jgi:hypothetical protein
MFSFIVIFAILITLVFIAGGIRLGEFVIFFIGDMFGIKYLAFMLFGIDVLKAPRIVDLFE